jgi:hypothetical protein
MTEEDRLFKLLSSYRTTPLAPQDVCTRYALKGPWALSMERKVFRFYKTKIFHKYDNEIYLIYSEATGSNIQVHYLLPYYIAREIWKDVVKIGYNLL